MYIYMICIFWQYIVLNSSTKTTTTWSISYKHRLFEIGNDVNDLIRNRGKGYHNNNKIEKLAKTLTYNLSIILYQMSNEKYDSLPNKILVLEANPKTLHEIKHREKHYEQQVCLQTLKCLDFVYIYLKDIDSVMMLYKMFYSVCKLWRPAITQLCRADNDFYVCSKESILELYKLFYFGYGHNIYMEEDYKKENSKKKSSSFIVDLYNAINYMELITMQVKSTRSEEFYWEKINNGGQIRIIELENNLNTSDDENRKNLNNELQSNNDKYLDDLHNNKCNMWTLRNITTNPSTPDTVYELIFYTLMIIEAELQLKHITKYQGLFDNGKSLINLKVIENDMSNIFQELCNYVPSSLFYLTQNNKTSDTSLFDLYILLCSNWSEFLLSRCHYTTFIKSNSLIMICVIHSIWDKLLLNDPSLIYKSRRYDNVNDTKTCKNLGLRYVKENYKLIHRFYDVQEYFVWTTFDWLSCKYFITENHITSQSMDSIKEQTMLVKKVRMTFSEIYALVLPLNLNMGALLTLHNNVLSYIEYELEQYAYIHGIIIDLYFKYTGYNVSDERLVLLSKSFQWYTHGSKIIDKYLQLSGTYKPSNTTKPLIDAIDEICQTKMFSAIINAIPQSIQSKYERWPAGKLPSFDGIRGISTDYLTALNKLAVDNCIEAVKYMDIFIEITYKSILTANDVSKNALNLSCEEFVADVFIYNPREDINEQTKLNKL